jgi:hypothetical protein
MPLGRGHQAEPRNQILLLPHLSVKKGTQESSVFELPVPTTFVRYYSRNKCVKVGKDKDIHLWLEVESLIKL